MLELEIISDAPVTKASTPLFVDYLRRCTKPTSEWMSGLEFELFGYSVSSLERLDAAQVQVVLANLASSADDLVFESGVVVEAQAGAGGRVTVEPGGQIEFSGRPHRNLLETERDLRAYLTRLHEVAAESGFAFVAAGFDPIRTIEEQHWYPKPRYDVMRPYLATRGRRAWDMMCRTCAIQVSLDYGSEEDLAKKFILGNRLAPIITAIFANSPFENGAPSGYKSTRAAAWLETDTDRSGLSPLAFVEDLSLAAFVDYALNVPMIFTRRGGSYSNATAGLPFGIFLDGGASPVSPIFRDFTDHLTTIFTEARLKQYLELRSADGNQPALALALQALWKGLMYDRTALDEALLLAPKLRREDVRALQEHVAREGLAARFAAVSVLDVAKEIVMLAVAGLTRLAPAEVPYLDVLRQQVIEDEVCPADILLRNWYGSWHASLDQLIKYLHIT